MGDPVTLGFGGTASPAPPQVTPPAEIAAPTPSGVPTGVSFATMWTWFLLCFPPSWIANAFLNSDGSTGTFTEALFAAIVNLMTAPGDWAIDESNGATYPATVTSGGVPVTLNFPTGSKLQSQMRLKSMTGNALDLAAQDFYGLKLPRLPSESDSSYRARIIAGLYNDGITRPNIYAFLTNYTGIAPHLIDPDNPHDVGGYSAATNIAGITSIGGKKCFPSMDLEVDAVGPSTGPNDGGLHIIITCPPCFYGTDVGRAQFRYANPNGFTSPPGVYHYPPNGALFYNGWQGGFAYQVLIVTTYPQGFGAQGNAAIGYMTITGSLGGIPFTGATINTGPPQTYTNVSGGGYVKVSNTVSVVGGKSVFSTVTGGDPNSAFFNPRGLMPADLAAGRALVLQAVDRLRATGMTYWVETESALALAAAGYSS